MVANSWFLIPNQTIANSACQYLFKYMNKNAYQLEELLTFTLSASSKLAKAAKSMKPKEQERMAFIDHVAKTLEKTNKYSGTDFEEDDLSPSQRRSTRLLQVLMNKMNGAQQLPITLATLHFAGYKCVTSSYSFHMLMPRFAINHVKKMMHKFPLQESCESNSDNASNASSDSDDEESQTNEGPNMEIHAEEEENIFDHSYGEDINEKDNDDSDNVEDILKGTGATGRFLNIPTVGSFHITQAQDYMWRGERLAKMPLYIYVMAIESVRYNPETEEEVSGENDDLNPRGRKNRPNLIRYHPCHPLYNYYAQRVRQKILIPHLMGVPPKYPKFEGDNLVKAKMADSFARYMLVLLKPWVTANPLNDPSEVLEDLENEEIQDEYICDGFGTPGCKLDWDSFCDYVDDLRTDMKNENSPSKNTSLFLFNVIKNASRCNTTSTKKKNMLVDYRFRSARRKHDKEANQYGSKGDAFDSEDEEFTYYEDDVDLMRGLLSFDLMNKDQQQANTKKRTRIKEAYLESSTSSLDTHLRRTKGSKVEKLASKHKSFNFFRKIDKTDLAKMEQQEMYFKEKAWEEVEEEEDVDLTEEEKDGRVEEMYIESENTYRSRVLKLKDKYPPEFMGENSPDAPFNNEMILGKTPSKEQQDILNYWIPSIKELMRKARDNEGRIVNPDPKDVHRDFLHGGPGAGKSTVLKMLLRYIDYLVVKYDYMYQPYQICAPRGVAAAILEEQASTLHTMLSIPVFRKKSHMKVFVICIYFILFLFNFASSLFTIMFFSKMK